MLAYNTCTLLLVRHHYDYTYVIYRAHKATLDLALSDFIIPLICSADERAPPRFLFRARAKAEPNIFSHTLISVERLHTIGSNMC